MTNPSGVRVELVQVTPQLASEWLGRNAENQRLRRDGRVDQYARDMATGHWPITGDTIKVTADNRLIDGQHRLAAVMQAEVTVPMLIAYGVDPAVMPVLDTGAARTFADTLRVQSGGLGNRTLVAALARRIVQWERGNYLGQTGTGNEAPTHSEMLGRYEKEPTVFAAAAARGSDVSKAGLGQGTASGTAFFLFTGIDSERGHQFFDQYIIGTNLDTQTHPILALRNRITRSRRDERLRTAEQLALFIRAWNAWREDRPLGTVVVTSGGRRLTNQNFPQPK
jgi:hypothetical protein